MAKANYDALIIGSGSAGLISAIELANAGKRVIVCSKEAITESGSSYAQGGIAVPIHPSDSVEQHIADTLEVGQGHANPDVVKHYISQIENSVRKLSKWGMPFENLNNPDLLGHEGAHSVRRIVRVDSSGISGRIMMKELWKIASRHDNISIAQGNTLVELLTNTNGECIGGIFLDWNANLYPILAEHTVLASGGYSHIFSRSTGPDILTGDGIALAHQIGAEVKDLNLIQFHPTAYNYALDKYFLLSETLRGEGAILLNNKGERFMEQYDARLELASRAVVSEAVYSEEKSGNSPIKLDLSPLGEELIMSRFKAIYTGCKELGHDFLESPIPITPVAHYTIGGIAVDLECHTSISGLWAIGETSCSGLHGKDRLASNSLLECIVGGFDAAESIINAKPITNYDYEDKPEYQVSGDFYSTADLGLEAKILEIKKSNWQKMSFERDKQKLSDYINELSRLEKEYAQHTHLTDLNLNQIKNIIYLSKLIAKSII